MDTSNFCVVPAHRAGAVLDNQSASRRNSDHKLLCPMSPAQTSRICSRELACGVCHVDVVDPVLRRTRGDCAREFGVQRLEKYLLFPKDFLIPPFEVFSVLSRRDWGGQLAAVVLHIRAYRYRRMT